MWWVVTVVLGRILLGELELPEAAIFPYTKICLYKACIWPLLLRARHELRWDSSATNSMPSTSVVFVVNLKYPLCLSHYQHSGLLMRGLWIHLFNSQNMAPTIFWAFGKGCSHRWSSQSGQGMPWPSSWLDATAWLTIKHLDPGCGQRWWWRRWWWCNITV